MQDFKRAGIVDSTLREGEQRAGVDFTFCQKLEIISCLAAVGIEEIEVGVASPRSPELPELVREARRRAGRKTRIALWCRCREDDILFAHCCGPDILSLSIPVSDILIRNKLGRTRSWVIEELERSIAQAGKLSFDAISVGLEDATRAEKGFLLEIARRIGNSPATRLRLADTVGIATPGVMMELVRAVRESTSAEVGVHTHNDFGMATANGIAALEAGAQWVDATVLGIGERAGNCRLEEIAGYLALQKGLERYNAGRLAGLCRTVATIAGCSIQPHHPVIGERLFMCESGLHVQALALSPETYEPYDPLLTGQNRTLLFGRKTGRRAVQQALNSAGIDASGEETENLVKEVRRLAGSGSPPLAEQELISLARQRIGMPCNA